MEKPCAPFIQIKWERLYSSIILMIINEIKLKGKYALDTNLFFYRGQKAA